MCHFREVGNSASPNKRAASSGFAAPAISCLFARIKTGESLRGQKRKKKKSEWKTKKKTQTQDARNEACCAIHNVNIHCILLCLNNEYGDDQNNQQHIQLHALLHSNDSIQCQGDNRMKEIKNKTENYVDEKKAFDKPKVV